MENNTEVVVSPPAELHVKEWSAEDVKAWFEKHAWFQQPIFPREQFAGLEGEHLWHLCEKPDEVNILSWIFLSFLLTRLMLQGLFRLHVLSCRCKSVLD